MPRAFLITHRRYNGAGEEFNGPDRDYSPDRGVRLVDYSGGQPMSDGASECGSETSSECPEELYNLTKLAEVSLAAAAGTLIHPSNVIYQRPVSPRCSGIDEECGRIVERAKQPQPLLTTHRNDFGEERGLAERTRFFFERIEPERESAEAAVVDGKSEILRLSPHHRHRHSHHHRNDSHLRIPVVRNFSDDRRDSPTDTSSPTPGISPAKRNTSVSPTGTGKSEDNEDHECPDCGKKYSTSSNLARHRQTHRSLGDKKARRCPHCDKIYVSMPAFSMHVRTHNQGCKCHYCGKCFSRPWLLQGHIRTHTGEKPFKCTICNKAFADKSNLRAHIQTHSNTKPHVCARCGKAFALKSYLYKHEESSCMRAHHRTSTENNKAEQQVEQKATVVDGKLERGGQTSGSATASPTSVIVPPSGGNSRDQRDASSTVFSAIIKHTRSSDDSSTAAKRPCAEKATRAEGDGRSRADNLAKESDYVSRMVIRTSVISPNPEHLGRFANESAKKSSSGFDFTDPARTSAFSRPTSMTLNLAIA